MSLSELWPSGSWFAWYAFDCLKTALSRLPFVGSAIRTYLSDAFVVVAGTPPRHTGNIKQNATSQTFLVHAVLHCCGHSTAPSCPERHRSVRRKGIVFLRDAGLRSPLGPFRPPANALRTSHAIARWDLGVWSSPSILWGGRRYAPGLQGDDSTGLTPAGRAADTVPWAHASPGADAREACLPGRAGPLVAANPRPSA